jgi:hypothetical protein
MRAIPTSCIGLGVMLVCCCAIGSGESAIGKKERSNDELIGALNQPVIGPMMGPSTGIRANAATRAVVKRGRGIVPDLIYALEHSSWRQSVWIVFCLTELRASSARERVLKLRDEIDQGRFTKENERHDFTLDVWIRCYLRTEAQAHGL